MVRTRHQSAGTRSALGKAGATIAAGALALAGVTTFIGVTAPAAGAQSGSLERVTDAVTDGALNWGVKESFRTYIEGPIADGEITLTPPATRADDGTFVFPDGSGTLNPDARAASLAFGGGVTFSGHGGALYLSIEDIRVEIDGDEGTLVADVSSTGEAAVAATTDDVAFVTLDLTGVSLEPDADGIVSVSGVPTTLTAAGAGAFGGFYEAGQEMDPLSFEVALAPAEQPTVTVTPSQGLDPEGDTITVAGEAFTPAEPGVYVAFGPGGLAEPWSEPAETFFTVVWVHPGGAGPGQGDLADDGTFSVELDVAAVDGVDSYAVYTFAAHGSPDRSQDTTTDVTFGSEPTETPTETPTQTPTQSPTESPTTSPTTTDEPTTPAFGPDDVSSGLLVWGFKESFRTYIGSVAHGGWTLDGVTEKNGLFNWNRAAGTYDMDSAVGTVSFAGGVHFTGHDGALDLTISRPQVKFTGDASKAQLLLDVTSASLDGGDTVVQKGVVFATLDLSAADATIDDDTVYYRDIPATLTAAGSEGFGGFYQAGTELDPLTLRFAVGGETVPGGGTLGNTGATQPWIPLTGAGLVLVGAGLLVARRRLQPAASDEALAA